MVDRNRETFRYMLKGLSRVLLTLGCLVTIACSGIGSSDQIGNQVTIKATVAEAAPGRVNIYRDNWGVPHIYAQREQDGYWGLGYAAAEDRLEGLLLSFLTVRGEVAKKLDPNKLGEDIEYRRWRFIENARENFPRLSPQLQANMTAYIAGVQRYLDDHPERVPKWAPTLEPSLPLALSAAFMMAREAFVCNSLVESVATAHYRDWKPLGLMTASNGWALAPERTTDGAAIFVSDSHGSVEVPHPHTFLNSARIKAGALDAWLLDLAGLPMGLKGHSRHFAWAYTEGLRYPADCIAVTTETDDPTAYKMDDIVKRMKTEPYIIEVKGGESIRGVFEYTQHNGVLSPVVHRQGDTAYVVSNAYMGRAGFAIEQFRMMLGAQSSYQMEAALSRRDIYPANLIMSGADGTIRFIRPGPTPIRPKGVDGSAVVDGSTLKNAWLGIRPLDEMLHIVNPSEGYLTNSNVSPDMMFAEPRIDPNDYPPDFGFEPGLTNTRQLRAIELLSGDNKLSFEDAVDVLIDAHAEGYRKWNTVFSSLGARYAKDRYFMTSAFDEFFKSLISLDGNFVPESRSALAHHLTRNVLYESAGDDANTIEDAIVAEKALTAEQQEALFSAVRMAFDKLQTRSDAATATFGDLYRVGRGGMRESSRGIQLWKSGMVSLFNSAYVADGDSGEYIAEGGSRHPFIVQFTKPIRSMSAAAYGASDNPESPHYSDQSVLRGEGKLRNNYFNPDELSKAIESQQTYVTDIPINSH